MECAKKFVCALILLSMVSAHDLAVVTHFHGELYCYVITISAWVNTACSNDPSLDDTSNCYLIDYGNSLFLKCLLQTAVIGSEITGTGWLILMFVVLGGLFVAILGYHLYNQYKENKFVFFICV
jgi:hypothetical protein